MAHLRQDGAVAAAEAGGIGTGGAGGKRTEHVPRDREIIGARAAVAVFDSDTVAPRHQAGEFGNGDVGLAVQGVCIRTDAARNRQLGAAGGVVAVNILDIARYLDFLCNSGENFVGHRTAAVKDLHAVGIGAADDDKLLVLPGDIHPWRRAGIPLVTQVRAGDRMLEERLAIAD